MTSLLVSLLHCSAGVGVFRIVSKMSAASKSDVVMASMCCKSVVGEVRAWIGTSTRQKTRGLSL